MPAYTKEQQVGGNTELGKKLLSRSTFAKKKPSGNKYGARRDTFNGRSFDSMTEADYARELEIRKLAKDIKDYKCQHRLDLRVNGQHVSFYIIDFMVTHNDDRIELVEVKGAETRDWRAKFDLTKALLPSGDIAGIPKDARLTLVKKQGKKFVHHVQLLNYK